MSPSQPPSNQAPPFKIGTFRTFPLTSLSVPQVTFIKSKHIPLKQNPQFADVKSRVDCWRKA
jgi:hypothetical protein